jgi:hypothetical protein
VVHLHEQIDSFHLIATIIANKNHNLKVRNEHGSKRPSRIGQITRKIRASSAMLRRDCISDSNGEIGMVDGHGRFVWYELLTTDMAAAGAFYSGVLGWGSQDASTPDVAYTLFTVGTAPVSGLMELPPEGRKKGAMPRWVGYVAVDDVDAIVRRFKDLGGAVYVPPTETNIGRISVVADPQTATLALVNGLKSGPQQPAGLSEPGHVGWHELLADDWKKAFAFYRELFGWQEADEIGSTEKYRLFAAGGLTMGGMFTKRPTEPVPFWLYYFNIDDLDTAMERVKTSGGQIFEGPLELPDGGWIARCGDPQGAAFALQGMRSEDAIRRSPPSDVRWSSEWGEFSSRGRLRVTKPGS